MQDTRSIFWLYLLRLCGAFEVFRISAEMAQENIAGPAWMIPTLFAGIALCALGVALWQGLVDRSWVPDFSAPAMLSSYFIGGLLALFALARALSPSGWTDLAHIFVMGGLGYAAVLHGYRSQKAFFGD